MDPNQERIAKWTRCHLSGELLTPPCVADELGHLFNKDSIVAGVFYVPLTFHADAASEVYTNSACHDFCIACSRAQCVLLIAISVDRLAA